MLDDETQEWERLALEGDFSRLPKPFLWRDSGRLAHFLDGYRVAIGFDELSRLAIATGDAARSSSTWQGTALELWMCLFFAHRAARHTGSDPSNGDELCEALRKALQALDPREAYDLATRLTPG